MRRRRNTWDDLPATFAPTPAPRPDVPEEWEDLPPMFFAPASASSAAITPRPAEIAIDLSAPKGVRSAKVAEDLLRAGEEVARSSGASLFSGLLVFPRPGARIVHEAVQQIVTDSARDYDLRAAALELAKRIESATGISPQRGFYELARSTGVMHELVRIARDEGLLCPLKVRPSADKRQVLQLGVETGIQDVCGCGEPNLHKAVVWRDPTTGVASFVTLWQGIWEDPVGMTVLMNGTLLDHDWHVVTVGELTPLEWLQFAEDGYLPAWYWNEDSE